MTDLEHAKLFLETIPRTMRSVRSEIRKAAGNEFTTPQFRLLAKISRDSSTNQELAEWMGVSAPTMSKMVDKLVERGLVSRQTEPDSTDRRRIFIRATSRGAQRSNEIRGIVQQGFSQRINGLSAAKKRELLAGLKVLKELFS
jgi:DNA-binding MarR family transcriptional regulator